jgi:hypothetical protein
MADKTLSDALDEIYMLRLLLASEARILEAHTEYKTFPKSRREIATGSIRRMRAAVRGFVEPYNPSAAKREFQAVAGTQTMTMTQWQAEGAKTDD